MKAQHAFATVIVGAALLLGLQGCSDPDVAQPTELIDGPGPSRYDSREQHESAFPIAGPSEPKSGATGAVLSASENEVTITFDDLSDGAVVTTQYADKGVTFAGAGILRSGASLNPPYPPHSGSNVVYDRFTGVITAQFSEDVSEVGAYITGNRIITMRCFDGDGALVGSMSTPAPNYVGSGSGVAPNFYVSVSGNGIRRCEIRDGGNTFTVDDFFFKKGCAVDVVRLSQGAAPWAGDTYDHINKTIQQKGCAMTSVAMLLNEQGITTDPRALNNLLKATTNAYTSSGGVVWQVAVNAGSGGTRAYRALPASTTAALDNALCEGHAVIVGVEVVAGKPGHFIVVTGKQGDTYTIADPGHADRTTLESYDNAFQARGYLVPTVGGSLSKGQGRGLQSSSSTLVLSLDDADFMVTDALGRRAGYDPVSGQILAEIPGSSYVRDALGDDVTGEAPEGFTAILSIEGMSADGYDVTITGSETGRSRLGVNVIGDDGTNHFASSAVTVTVAGSSSTYAIDSDGSFALVRTTSFDGAIADVRTLLASGDVDGAGIAQSIIAKLEAARAAADRGSMKAAKNQLNALRQHLEAQRGRHVSELGASILLDDVAFLAASIG